MLQWPVYKQSEPWERETERGGGLYLPTGSACQIMLDTGACFIDVAKKFLLHRMPRLTCRVTAAFGVAAARPPPHFPRLVTNRVPRPVALLECRAPVCPRN